MYFEIYMYSSQKGEIICNCVKLQKIRHMVISEIKKGKEYSLY